MRLLFAIKSLNVEGGGAERVLVDVVNGLSTRGHEIQVLTFDQPGKSFYSLNDKVKRLDAGIGQPGQSTPRINYLRAIPRIRRMVLDANAELVVGFMHSTYVPLAAALIGANTRLVVSEHVDSEHYRTRPLQRLMVSLVDRTALGKTVPSIPLREQHSLALRQRVHVLPNTVALDDFIHLQSISPSGSPSVLLSVGRLMSEKNHVELIRAFSKISGKFPDWILKIVGDGELRSLLEREVEQLGMTGQIFMPGATRDVASEYKAASFVVLPSLYESFGLVAAEALAAGRPVLAFDNCMGISELIKSGENGLLVPTKPDRITSLAMGLERLMSDPKLRRRLAVAGPASVSRFGMSNVLDTWESFLRQLVSQINEA